MNVETTDMEGQPDIKKGIALIDDKVKDIDVSACQGNPEPHIYGILNVTLVS